MTSERKKGNLSTMEKTPTRSRPQCVYTLFGGIIIHVHVCTYMYMYVLSYMYMYIHVYTVRTYMYMYM